VSGVCVISCRIITQLFLYTVARILTFYMLIDESEYTSPLKGSLLGSSRLRQRSLDNKQSAINSTITIRHVEEELLSQYRPSTYLDVF
jgi:hypothetical protein